MRVAFGADFHALAVFVVHNVEDTIGNEDAVGSPKAVLNPAGEVHPLFNHDHRVGAGLLCGLQELHHIGGISGGAFFHLLVVPGQVLDGVFRRNAQSLFQSVLAKGVGIRALSSVITAFVLVGFAEPCGGRAVEPPIG